MNIIERCAVRIGWRWVVKKGSLKRWLPLISVLVLATATVSRVLGQTGTADGIEAVAKLVGLVVEDPALGAEVVAAFGAMAGVALKIVALAKRA